MGVETKRMSSSVRWLAPAIVAALVTVGGFVPEVDAQLARGAASVEVEGTQFKVTLPDGRMVRADYGGDGHGTTRDGMLIDIYDAWRIQTPDLREGQDFEAGWSPEGAVCVRHVRVKENVSLEELERLHPRLKGRTGTACTE